MRLEVAFCILFCTSVLAQTPETVSPNQSWLGRGLIGSERYKRDVKSTYKLMKKYAESKHKDVLPKSHWEKIFKAAGEPHFLGLACVGKSASGRTNCYKVQPLLIHIQSLTVVQRGPVLLVGEPMMSSSLQSPVQANPEPSRSQIRKFIREMRQDYHFYIQSEESHYSVPWLSRMFAVGSSASKPLSNQDGWNWASEATPVTKAAFEAFRSFIMKYQSRVSLTTQELYRAFELLRTQEYQGRAQIIAGQVRAIAESEKRKILLERPFPKY